MDDVWLHYALFLVATFAAALVAGISGFAFGLIAAAAWLHFLTPIQTATLIIAFGLLVQGISVWKLRHAAGLAQALAFRPRSSDRRPARRRDPGLGGCSAGADRRRRFPRGSTASTAWHDRRSVRCASAARRSIAGVGFLNGVLAGVTGLAGILVVIWCGLRGWSKDVQRGVFQPAAVATFAMTALWLGAKGAIATDTVTLFLLGLPVLLAGTWLGLKLYGRIDEAGFRRIVLVLLLLSGLMLVAPSLRW